MKSLLLSVILISFLTTGGMASADTSSKDNYKEYSGVLIDEELVVPTVVEIFVTDMGITPYDFLVLDQASQLVVPHHLITKTDRHEINFTVSNENGSLLQLSDNNFLTSAHFPLSNGEETITMLDLVADLPIAALGINLQLDRNVASPKWVKVISFDEAAGEEVLFYGKYDSDFGGVRFPKTTAKNWRLELMHDQPLRFSEINFVESGAPVTKQRFLRFLAQPDTDYRLYHSSNGSKTYSNAPELASISKVLNVSLTGSESNPSFVELDRDKDGLVDYADNCPAVSNSDQADIDGSGVGDMCEDFDVDMVPNPKDNCPNIPNQNQNDTDGDGAGDACDGEESRVTEKYPWISWIGLVLAMLMIGSMFLMVRRQTETLDTNNIA